MTIDVTDSISLPEKDTFRDKIDQRSLKKEIFDDMTALVKTINKFDEPIAFEFLLKHASNQYGYSIDPSSNNALRKHKGRLDKLAKYDPTVYLHVVGRIPTAEVWIDLALKRIEAGEVTGANLNQLQQACTALQEDISEEYYDATKREIQRLTLAEIDIDNFESTEELVETLLEEVTDSAIEILPERQESMRQGGQSSAGSANEEIVRRSLSFAGLDIGEDKADCDVIQNTENADLILYDATGAQWSIEIKSTAVRERTGRAIQIEDSDTDGHPVRWVLFGFFETASEIRSAILEGNDQKQPLKESTDLVYLPPTTLQEVRRLDKQNLTKSASQLTNADGKLLLRANTVFPEDMRSLTNSVELPELSVGHESEYL